MRLAARWRVRNSAIVALVLLASGTGAAFSQSADNPFRPADPPCVLDECLNPPPGQNAPPASIPAPDAPRPAGTNVANGVFDFYVLALSWSPGFCQTAGAAHARQQCEPGAKLGFVVHGLWPQNQHGYPSNCDSAVPFPSRMALNATRGLYPDEGLARHEWRMHGTCTGKSPTDYFADVRRARESVAVPAQFQAPGDDQQWAPMDIARAFMAANPRLRLDTMAVTCRQNRLEEVRICLSKDLRGFVPCPEIARASCRRPVEVPPVL